MSESDWLAWTILIPLVGAMSAYVSGRRAPAVGTLFALGTVIATVGLVAEVAMNGPLRHAVGGWEPPLGIRLRADGIAALMLGTVACVGVAVTAHAWLDVGDEPHAESPKRFFSLWLLHWAAIDALVLSGDVFNMYVSLELTTLSAVALLGASRSRASNKAALHYLLFAMVGSLAYLIGVILLYGSQSVLDTAMLGAASIPQTIVWVAASFMFVGLALKSALFPFHTWLPPAYASATTSVAVVLAALVSKSGLYLLLRVWTDVLGDVGGPMQVLGALGAGGIVWGGILALRQHRLSMVLAYSSVSQISYVFSMFAIGTPSAVEGGLYLIVSHMLAKASMFFAAGAIHRVVGHDDLRGMKGLAHRLPVAFFALAISGMSLVGLPPTGGFIAKWILTVAALEVGQWWWAIIILGGGLLTAAYVFRVLRIGLLPGDGESGPEVAKTVGSEISAWIALALALAAAALVLLPAWVIGLIHVSGAS